MTANWVSAQSAVYFTRKSQVSFISDAPLELIKAASSQLKGYLDAGKHTFYFEVPSASFTGFNSPLQQVHFYENYLESQKYPEASFKGKIIEQTDFSRNGDYTIRAKGSLMIHGVEQERIIRVRIMVNRGIMLATSDFSVLLREHNIKVPKVVYQKIAEEIMVHVSMEMIRK